MLTIFDQQLLAKDQETSEAVETSAPKPEEKAPEPPKPVSSSILIAYIYLLANIIV